MFLLCFFNFFAFNYIELLNLETSVYNIFKKNAKP